jgi:hypothetical protein
MKQIYDYVKICTHLRCFGSRFTQNFVRARTRARSDTHDFCAVIFGSHLSLRNRSMIYAKIHTHLRCFGSRFTHKFARSRTRARSEARDFYVVMFGPIRRYETDLRFTLKFLLIYAKICLSQNRARSNARLPARRYTCLGLRVLMKALSFH